MPAFSTLWKFCCCCCDKQSILEASQPAPPEGTPNFEMYIKYGICPIMYNALWNKYTKGDPQLQWPLEGTMDPHKLEYLEK